MLEKINSIAVLSVFFCNCEVFVVSYIVVIHFLLVLRVGSKGLDA